MDQTLAVNVRAAMIVSQVVSRGIIERGRGGTIVNISSQASKVALPDHTTYCISKGALDQLTRMMALELGKYDIPCQRLESDCDDDADGQDGLERSGKSNDMLAKIPLGRFAEPQHRHVP